MAVHIVLHENILYILAHKASLDVECLKIRHCHDDDIGIHLHHQRNEFVLTDIVSSELVILLGHIEYTVFGVARNIVDRYICVIQDIFDISLEIFVEAIAF